MLTALTIKVRTVSVETVSESEEEDSILSSDEAGLGAPDSPMSDAYDQESLEAYDSAYESPSCDGFSGDEIPLRLRDTADDLFSDSEGEEWESFQQEDESDLDSECDCTSILSESEVTSQEAADDALAGLVTSIKNVSIVQEAQHTEQPGSPPKVCEAKHAETTISQVKAPAIQDGEKVNGSTNDSEKATGDSPSSQA
jgi:hypothetical protein